MERHFGTALAWAEAATVTRWLAALPDEQVRARPRLCALRAVQAVRAGQPAELERWLDAADAALAGAAGETVKPGRPAGFQDALDGDLVVRRRLRFAHIWTVAGGHEQCIARSGACQGNLWPGAAPSGRDVLPRKR